MYAGFPLARTACIYEFLIYIKMIEIRAIIEFLDSTSCADDRKECEVFGPGYNLAIRELERLEKVLDYKNK